MFAVLKNSIRRRAVFDEGLGSVDVDIVLLTSRLSTCRFSLVFFIYSWELHQQTNVNKKSSKFYNIYGYSKVSEQIFHFQNRNNISKIERNNSYTDK